MDIDEIRRRVADGELAVAGEPRTVFVEGERTPVLFDVYGSQGHYFVVTGVDRGQSDEPAQDVIRWNVEVRPVTEANETVESYQSVADEALRVGVLGQLLVDQLPALDPDHEIVQLALSNLRTTFSRLTSTSSVTAEGLMSGRDSIARSQFLLEEVRRRL